MHGDTLVPTDLYTHLVQIALNKKLDLAQVIKVTSLAAHYMRNMTTPNCRFVMFGRFFHPHLYNKGMALGLG